MLISSILVKPGKTQTSLPCPHLAQYWYNNSGVCVDLSQAWDDPITSTPTGFFILEETVTPFPSWLVSHIQSDTTRGTNYLSLYITRTFTWDKPEYPPRNIADIIDNRFIRLIYIWDVRVAPWSERADYVDCKTGWQLSMSRKWNGQFQMTFYSVDTIAQEVGLTKNRLLCKTGNIKTFF